VNIVLANNAYGYNISCNAEETQSVIFSMGNGLTKSHLSRVDKSWSYDGGLFAILEFKRPGAIKPAEWFNTANDTVWGSGDHICRQLKKYAYAYGLRYVGVCDLNTLILMQLGGDQNQWYNATPENAPTTSAYFRYITDKNQMKRQMYVFLKEALDFKLRADGRIR
jgi:hypothetical protein